MRRLGKLALASAVILGLAACGDDDPADVADTTTSTIAPESTSTTVEATTTTLTSFPPERVPEHGGTTWAAVLAGSADPSDPALEAAVEAATAAGYTTGPTDCDVGAAEVLGLEAGQVGIVTVSVYFETEAAATQALQAFHERGTAGGAVGQVQTFCLD